MSRSLLASCSFMFNFVTDISIFSFLWPIRSCPAYQLVLVHGHASGSICQLSHGQEACLHVFCALTMMPHCSRGCGLCLETTNLWIPRFGHFTPETERCWKRPAPCMSFFTLKAVKRSSSRWGSRKWTRARYTWPTVQHTRLPRRSMTFFFLLTVRLGYQSYCSLFLNS